MKQKPQIKTAKRKAYFMSLQNFCTFSSDKPDDYVEITKWANGEGIDVRIGTSQKLPTIHLTYGQFNAIKYLIKSIQK